MEKKYFFGSLEDWRFGVDVLGMAIAPFENSEFFVITVAHCDKGGSYSSMDVYIYDSYVAASEKIQEYEYEYSWNNAVDVYAVKHSDVLPIYESVHIKQKLFDAPCYSCLAACTPSRVVELTFARKLHDTNAVVHVITK